jgi:hypothetical protein
MIAMVAIANLQYTWTLFTVPLSTGLNARLSDVQLTFTLFASIFAGWGAAKLLEATGSWTPVLWPRLAAICWLPPSPSSASSRWSPRSRRDET